MTKGSPLCMHYCLVCTTIAYKVVHDAQFNTDFEKGSRVEVAGFMPTLHGEVALTIAHHRLHRQSLVLFVAQL